MEYIYPILLALGRFGGIVYVLLLCTLCLACAFWLKPAKSEESFFFAWSQSVSVGQSFTLADRKERRDAIGEPIARCWPWEKVTGDS